VKEKRFKGTAGNFIKPGITHRGEKKTAGPWKGNFLDQVNIRLQRGKRFQELVTKTICGVMWVTVDKLVRGHQKTPLNQVKNENKGAKSLAQTRKRRGKGQGHSILAGGECRDAAWGRAGQKKQCKNVVERLGVTERDVSAKPPFNGLKSEGRGGERASSNVSRQRQGRV